MASVGAAYIDTIIAMSDAELDHFLKPQYRPDGGYDLPPVDCFYTWGKLSKDQRDRLDERLKALERYLAQLPTAYSRPLNLEYLDARLRQMSSDNRSFSLARQQSVEESVEHSGPPTPPFDREDWLTRHDIECYHQLVNDGGRPVFPIDLIRDIFFRNTDNYVEMLRPWQEHPDNTGPKNILPRQLRRWQDFRKWQNDNRDREDDDGGFLEYVELEKKRIQQRFEGMVEWLQYDEPRATRKAETARYKEEYEKDLAKIEADPACLKPKWERIQREREEHRYSYRERGCQSFREYAEAVKHRLARHGFTQPFELDEEPKKQDKLTTWIEYLNYEYWWLDKYTREIERLAPDEDKAWQKLVDMNILRPHETKDKVRTYRVRFQHKEEEEQARRDVQSAKSDAERIYVLTQVDPQRVRIPSAKRLSMMRAATTKLHAAKTRSKQIKSRWEQIAIYIRETINYGNATRYATCHRMLTQWVLDQIVLIEAEMAPAQAEKADRHQSKGTKRSRLTTDEEPPMKRLFKKGRFGLQESDRPPSRSTRVSPKAREMQPEPRVVTDSTAARGPQIETSATRRSARIAARTAPESTNSPPTSRLRPRVKLREVYPPARRSRQSTGESTPQRRRSARIAARTASESFNHPPTSRLRSRAKLREAHPPAGLPKSRQRRG
ncbi:hypothetical protein F4778DRAFT_785706 [Xylariomycetidae sp. FL2044]|nr:hypothetical protein F4778DRAFT_785706 [Xylariomycetidae sp. FL2044]